MNHNFPIQAICFNLLYQNQELVGYSKITLNHPYKLFKESDHSKMERLYLLKKTLDSGLGKILFDFNIELAKSADKKLFGFMLGLRIIER